MDQRRKEEDQRQMSLTAKAAQRLKSLQVPPKGGGRGGGGAPAGKSNASKRTAYNHGWDLSKAIQTAQSKQRKLWPVQRDEKRLQNRQMPACGS